MRAAMAAAVRLYYPPLLCYVYVAQACVTAGRRSQHDKKPAESAGGPISRPRLCCHQVSDRQNHHYYHGVHGCFYPYTCKSCSGTMGSDSRWHRSDCGQPSVVFEGGVLRCRSCGATPLDLVDRLIAQGLARGGEIHLPADTPLGEAHLWWPYSVPYHSPQVDFGRNSRHYFIGKQATTAGQSNRGAEQSSASPIYPSSLDAGHFRLIYITEYKDESSPIHIRLIEHDLEDHPEYETVSYVWG